MTEANWAREDALVVLDRSASVRNAMEAIFELAEAKLSSTEVAGVRMAFANIIAELLMEIEMPIYNVHGDLTPDHLRLDECP